MNTLSLIQKGERFYPTNDQSRKTLVAITKKASVTWDELDDLEIVCNRHGRVKVEVQS